MRIWFGTIAAAIVVMTMAAQPAEARCWWSGYGWTCNDHRDRGDRDRFDRRDRVQQFDRFGEQFDRHRVDRDRFERRQFYNGGGYEHQNTRWGY